ncbi:MAG: serine hydrolase domain-containing protein [Gammaproteobacteria bacterium]
MNDYLTRLALLLSLFVIGGCTALPGFHDQISISVERAGELHSTLTDVIARHQINTAGVAVIRDGRVVWSNHYGQQSPGVAASDQTLYDVGSITKTVVAETVLRLVEDGKLSLDEPMSAHWLDPDLKDDPRHLKLTPRMALSHTTGFMNWRFFAEDGKLAFIAEPGSRFGYSGEGFKYLAKFVEAKLGESFETLARRYVFEPAGVTAVAMSVKSKFFPRIAQPLDTEGRFPGYYCRPEGWCRKEGDFSAAGGMVISLPDYARFMAFSMRGDGLTQELMDERDRLQSVEKPIDCNPVPEAQCPVRVGYGLGWNIAELDNNKTIGHRGSDWSVVSLAYYYEDSRDGFVVLLNAPNRAGIAAMVDVLRLLDPGSPELHGYIARRARAAE